MNEHRDCPSRTGGEMSEQPKCTLRDAELLADVGKWVSKLCDTGGRAWTLSVPVNFNRDPDMLITELCKRYAALRASHNELKDAAKGLIAIHRRHKDLTVYSDQDYRDIWSERVDALAALMGEE